MTEGSVKVNAALALLGAVRATSRRCDETIGPGRIGRYIDRRY
jgi:hypothetical protein